MLMFFDPPEGNMEPARPPRPQEPLLNDGTSVLPNDGTSMLPNDGTSMPRLPAAPPLGAPQPIPSLIPSQSSHCHFLGSLTIAPYRESSTSALPHTLGHVSQWLGRFFPPRARLAISPMKLQESGACRNGDIHLSTLCHRPLDCQDSDTPIHAIAVEHTDRHLTERRWRTEIVMKQLPNKDVKLYIGVYHGLRGGFIGEPPAPPSPTTPTLIHDIVRSPRVRCFYDIVKSVESPLQVHDTAQQAGLFAQLLLHPNRSSPIVLMNMRHTLDGNVFAWDPHALTRGCFGSGTVVVPSSPLRVDGPFLSTLAEELGANGYRFVAGLQHGGVRVFQPRMSVSYSEEFKRHRYFHPSQGPEVPRWIQDGLRHTLRASLDANNEAFTFDGVQRAITRNADTARWQELQERVKVAIARDEGVAIETERDNLKNLVVALQEELNRRQQESIEAASLQTKYSQSEEERVVAQELLDGATIQISDLQDELEAERESRFKAEKESAVYKQLLESKQDADASRKVLTIPSKLPNEPHEVVEILRKQLAPRVVILDTALASSYDIPLSRMYDTWECLVALHEVLWPLHFDETADEDQERKVHRIPAQFTTKTGIDYSVNESATTNRDSDLMRQRRITVDGREYDFSAHLKVGNKAKDALRIHFAVDDGKKQILVWHCGEHLDTAGTRRKR